MLKAAAQQPYALTLNREQGRQLTLMVSCPRRLCMCLASLMLRLLGGASEAGASGTRGGGVSPGVVL